MPSILLPVAKIAEKSVKASVSVANTSIGLAAGYLGGMAPVIANLTLATTNITIIQTTLTPSGAISPPSRIGLNTCAAALSQIVTVNASIVAAGVQSVALAGAPSPTFPVAGQLVVTQLEVLGKFISTFLVKSQQ
tara:strand:- start:347 stop:751 length:405 start_codon:yes stop_codon:yes gene_type:complete